MKVEKGGLAYVDGIWYIIVAVRWVKGIAGIDCICDHANNIHYFTFDQVEYFASLDEIHSHSYGNCSERFAKIVNGRPIPHAEIVSVLSGNEDDRFDHWHENN